jgi:hypothetical protein
MPPKFLDTLKCEFEVKTLKEQGIGDTLPGSQHFGGRKGMLELRDGTRKSDKHLITHMDMHKSKQQFG